MEIIINTDDFINAVDEILSNAINTVLSSLLEDAAAYLKLKYTDVILNGEDGTEYPKTYPASISAGASGFVGVVTKNLSNSITQFTVSPFHQRVKPDASAFPIEEYYKVIAQWSKQKYGMNYMEIGKELYGDFIIKTIRDTMNQAIKVINDGGSYTYSNPFPL